MQFNEIYEKTVYAFENGEVYELLIGKNGYAYQAPMAPVSVPTFCNYVFDSGIYPYFASADATQKEKIMASLKQTIREMLLSENAIDVWWAVALLYHQKSSESKHKNSPFFISGELLSNIETHLFAARDKLEASKMYQGGNYENGLWGDVLRYNTLFKKYFNMSILR